MHCLYTLYYVLQIFLLVIAHPILREPISLKKYDQGDIFLEEEKTDIFRDIKTIYAPEFRIYSNGSLNNFLGKGKRALKNGVDVRHDNCITNDDIKPFLNYKSQENHIDEDELEETVTNNVMERFDISDRLVDKIISRNKSMNTIFLRNASSLQNTTKFDAEKFSKVDNLNISSFWHSTLGTNEIRNLQSMF